MSSAMSQRMFGRTSGAAASGRASEAIRTAASGRNRFMVGKVADSTHARAARSLYFETQSAISAVFQISRSPPSKTSRTSPSAHRRACRSSTILVGSRRVREPSRLLIVWPESRVLHPERIEQARLHELRVWHSADHLNDAPAGVDAGLGHLLLLEFGQEFFHRIIEAH